MRYDDDRYFDDEEDKDFWDDELELTSGDTGQETDYSPLQPYDSESPDGTDGSDTVYQPDDADEAGHQPEGNTDGYQENHPPKPRRERFFGKKDPDEEEDNDYYDSDSDPAPAPARKHKTPKLDPEDPDYWIEEEESPLSSIIPTTDNKWKWKLGAVIAIVALIIGAWIWFFRPYADNAIKYGYIKNMERRGSLFKTFEGTMIPYKELGDPDPLYFQEVRFSVAGDSLAASMKRMMLGCLPVRVEYETYHTPLPWKGEQRMIIVKADTADPRKILPPEYRHNDK